MEEADKQRMVDLLRKNRRKKLVPAIVQKWAAQGISASPLSDERQQKLIADFRTWACTEYRPIPDLEALLLSFLKDESVVVVIDFDVNEEPALLLPARALSRSEEHLRKAYPDGFVVFREGAALTIDFEEQVGHANVSYATAS